MFLSCFAPSIRFDYPSGGGFFIEKIWASVSVDKIRIIPSEQEQKSL